MTFETWCAEIDQKEQDGILTFKEAPFNYLRLTSGKHKGRIVIKLYRLGEIDGEKITWFMAENLTWVYVKDIENCTCKRVGWGAKALDIDVSLKEKG